MSGSPSSDLFLQSIKSIVEGSSRLTTWSLSIVGGTILIIIGDSHLRPGELCYRYFYLCFLIGWVCIGFSLSYSFSITKSAMGSELNKADPAALMTILKKCNAKLAWQIRYFQYSLFAFGLWLVLYLLWWIFTDISLPK